MDTEHPRAGRSVFLRCEDRTAADGVGQRRAHRVAVDQNGYVSLDRHWKQGDVIAIEFPIETRWVAADDRVNENRRRMAIERGPIVYCAERPHSEGGEALGLLWDPARELTPASDKDFFAGVTVLQTTARNIVDPSRSAGHATLVPYHLWANRGPGEMTVWLSTREYAIGDTGPAGGLIFFVNPNRAADGWRYLEAAPFDQSGGAKWGCFRRMIAGARGTAIGTGKQNTADMLAACANRAAPRTCAPACASMASTRRRPAVACSPAAPATSR